MKNNEFYTLISILLTAVIIISGSIGYKNGYDDGKYDGYDEMFNAVTDTVNNIIKKQINSDSSVTDLTIINYDTNTYLLTRKTIFDESNLHK